MKQELTPAPGLVGGAIAGLSAAVFYTVSNTALRGSVAVDPFLVSAVKAAPTVLFLSPFLVWMRVRERTLATSWRMLPRFALAALIGQFVGNAGFQVALGSIGLAASVPITLGVMIVCGALLGRVILGEPVRPRTLAAMGTLILAVVVLSGPGRSTGGEVSGSVPLWLGALCAASSGAAYAIFSTIMRQTLNGGLSAPLTMLVSGAVGTLSLWGVTLLRVGTATIAEVESGQWLVMAIGGLFNFVAFVSLSLALKSLPVVAVNLINASQVAMAAAAGVILFAEPVTTPLTIGIGLTFAGLMILARSGNRSGPVRPGRS